MAYNKQTFFKIDVGFSAGSGAPELYKYFSEDTKAVVNASGYFDTNLALKVNDYIYIVSADGPEMVYVATKNPTTILPVIEVNTDIPDGSITKNKLASDVTTFVGIVDHTLAAAASDTVTVPGALTTDKVWACLTELGAPFSVDHLIAGAKVTSANTVTLYAENTFQALDCTVFVVRPAV